MPLIREVADGDAAAVIGLWRDAGLTRPWNDPAADLAFARRSPHATVLVAERDGEVVATTMVGEDGHRGWMYYVAAAPRREGLGRAVVMAAEAWLGARGIRRINLMIRGDNEDALGFYARLGYARSDVVTYQKVLPAPSADDGSEPA